MSEPTEVSIDHLRQHLSEFQQYLDIDIISPALRSAQLLTDIEEWYLTNRELSPQERITQLLLLVLARKGKRGASKFIECIRRTSDFHLPHEHLVQLFRRTRNEQEINSDRLENFKCLRKREEFTCFVMDVYKRLRASVTDLGLFKVFVTNCAISPQNPEYSLLQEHKVSILQAVSLDAVFVILSRYWNYKNVYVLEQLVKTFISRETAASLLSEYWRKVEEIDAIEETAPKLEPDSKSLYELSASERFSSLIQNILECFKQHGVSPEALRVYLSVMVSTSSQKGLDMTHSLEDIFTFMSFCVSWKRYAILEQIVELFGDEQSKLLVRSYNGDYQSHKSQNSCENSGSWHYREVVPFRSEHERKGFEMQVSMLRSQFAGILSQSLQLPKSSKHFIATLSASVRYPSLIQPYGDVANDAALSEVFLRLNHFGWNYRQCCLLQSLIEKYGTPELRSSIATYADRISAFEKNTTLAELLWVLPQGNPPSRSGFVHMTLGFNIDLQDYTVEELSKFQMAFSKMFHLHSCALVLFTAKTFRSSFKLKFVIPSGVDCIFLIESEEKADFFREHNILLVKLFEEGCYDFRYDFEQERSPHRTMKKDANCITKLADKLQEFESKIKVTKKSDTCTLF